MDILPEDNTGYGKLIPMLPFPNLPRYPPQYRDDRYSREDTFDWFRKFGDVADELHDLIPNRNARICMLGCGNSTLSQDMYDDGYCKIVNVDYSAVCIERMKALHTAARREMLWHEADIRSLPYEDDSFDVALDKGTMDALMTSKGDVWDPSQEIIDNCNAEVDEAVRILKPGGIFIYITFGQPHFRRRYLTRPNTTLTVTELKTAGFSYFLYAMRLDL